MNGQEAKSEVRRVRTTLGHAAGDESWARDYVLLTLRVGKAVEARTGDGWMLDYYGPPEWKALVDAEEPGNGGALLETALAAEETLLNQGFGATGEDTWASICER